MSTTRAIPSFVNAPPRASGPRGTLWLARATLTSSLRRPWLVGAIALGLAVVVAAAGVALTHAGAGAVDSYRASGAALLAIGGLVVALGLGATAVNADAEGGLMALQAVAGASRLELAAGRALGRLVALLAVLVAWGVALEAGALALGLGFDGPLAVHVWAASAGAALVLLAAAATSTVMGPTVSAIVGIVVSVVAQAVVNLEAAADQGRLGAAAPLVRVAYAALPHSVVSPMISDMQIRGQGGIAAPRFDINNVVVLVPASSVASVLWTLLWCALFAGLVASGLRRRPL